VSAISSAQREVKFFQYALRKAGQNWLKAKLFMKFNSLLLLFLLEAALVVTAAGDQSVLNAQLEPFRPLLEKTWKATFKNSTPDKPTIDVQRWERALNGQAVRVLHSINDGVYGGETIFIWDEQRKIIAYYYFTTESFMTSGTLEVKAGKFITHENVKGNANGVTEVRATSELLPDGKFHVKAEYFKNGQWMLGHEASYEETATAKVVFR
jgi:hypothetical protein